jgi:DNA repair ATPase RecN
LTFLGKCPTVHESPEVHMSEDKDTKRFGENAETLAGDALLHAVRRDMLALFKGLDHKLQSGDARVKALDEKVDARLHDTVPLWEGVVARLDAIGAEQESQGKRLAEIEGCVVSRLDAIEERLDAIDTEQRKQGSRLDAIEGRLDAIEIKLERFDAIDTELRHLSRRIERTITELSGDVVKYRMDQHDLEDRLEKLEKTPA